MAYAEDKKYLGNSWVLVMLQQLFTALHDKYSHTWIKQSLYSA